MTDPLQASSRAQSEASAMAPGSPAKKPLSQAPGSPNAKAALTRVEIERKLSSAGSRGDERKRSSSTAAERAKSTSPSSTDTDSDGGAGPSANVVQHGAANLASISENENDQDTDEDERRTIGSDDRSHMAGLSNEDTILSGYLEKKGERRKTWKKRWFVLRRTTLVYYKNAKEYRLLRMIPLAEVHGCADVQMKAHANVFGISTPKRTYYVRAKSRPEMDEWIDRITGAFQAVKGSGQGRAKGGDSAGEEGQADDEVPTPRGGGETPTAAGNRRSTNASTTAGNTGSQPISIQIPGTSTGGAAFSPSSYSTSTSGVVGSDNLSTSYTSQSSGFSSGTVPPNSAVSGPAAAVPASPDLAEVDHSLERLSTHGTPAAGGQANRSRAGSHAQSGTEYFGQQLHPQKGLHPPPSPGLVMSSSDEDDYYEEEQALPTSERKVAAPEAGKVIIQGYLMKQGKRRNWRKRFFTLTGRELVYSKSHMDKDRTPRRIPVTKILDAMEHDPTTQPRHQHSGQPSSPLGGHFNFPAPGGLSLDAKAADNCFKIITSQRTYLVAAATEDEEIRWLSALQCLIATRRHSQTGPSPTGQQPLSPPTLQTTKPQEAPQAASPSTEPTAGGLSAPQAQRRPSHGQALPSITSTLIAADAVEGSRKRSGSDTRS